MSLPSDGVNANVLAETTTIPTGKKLIFLDPDTNEGGIITLENLTKQILSNLATQTFNLDQGTKTLPAALNELNSKTKYLYFGTLDKKMDDLDLLSFVVPDGAGEAVNCVAWFGNEFISFSYISNEERALDMPRNSVYSITIRDKTSVEVRHKDGSEFQNNHHGFFFTRKR